MIIIINEIICSIIFLFGTALFNDNFLFFKLLFLVCRYPGLLLIFYEFYEFLIFLLLFLVSILRNLIIQVILLYRLLVGDLKINFSFLIINLNLLEILSSNYFNCVIDHFLYKAEIF